MVLVPLGCRGSTPQFPIKEARHVMVLGVKCGSYLEVCLNYALWRLPFVPRLRRQIQDHPVDTFGRDGPSVVAKPSS